MLSVLALLAAFAAQPPVTAAQLAPPPAIVMHDGTVQIEVPDGHGGRKLVDNLQLFADASDAAKPGPSDGIPLPSAAASSTPVLVPGAPTDLNGAVALIPQMIAAFQAGKTLVGVGFGIMLLVFVVTDLFWKDVEASKYKALIIAAVAAAGTMAGALIAGQPLLAAAEAGGETGLIAAGGWEVVGQHVLPILSAGVRWLIAKITGKSAGGAAPSGS